MEDDITATDAEDLNNKNNTSTMKQRFYEKLSQLSKKNANSGFMTRNKYHEMIEKVKEWTDKSKGLSFAIRDKSTPRYILLYKREANLDSELCYKKMLFGLTKIPISLSLPFSLSLFDLR